MRVVIDADVARAAGGEDATHPVSTSCRALLQAVLKICHHVVLTDELLVEWKEHRSRFARTWLTSMYARRKVCRIASCSREQLRESIEKVLTNERECAAMQKDCHLIEAALETDRTVISLDETVRRIFDGAALHRGELRAIIWVNPTESEEDVQDWLADGAPATPERQLGFRSR